MSDGEHVHNPHLGPLFDLGPLVQAEAQEHRAILVAAGVAWQELPIYYSPEVEAGLSNVSATLAEEASTQEDIRLLREFDFIQRDDEPKEILASRLGQDTLESLAQRATATVERLQRTDSNPADEDIEFLRRFVGHPEILPTDSRQAANRLLRRYEKREQYLWALFEPALMGSPIRGRDVPLWQIR